ncbi:MAG: aminotransferase class I/II-fold pyridoxal phosphate-dependent enzyme, partial [Opitutaceae bacterium]|nr:aminotransferase class I/II-fold pyridoxal phosphate-dependent enzyme [Cytophagales bacterium]
MNSVIPYGRQHITDQDIEAVIDALKSDFLTQGPKILEFEKAFADYIGSKYAVAVSNGTAALHLCTLALGVKEGHKVITTPITFAASANCVRYCGGEVIFADIDPNTYLLDFNKVKELLQASPKGSYKGIIPVDFAGRAVNLEQYRNLADEYGLWIIEDACHAPGGAFTDSMGSIQHCGNSKFADLAIFSFHPVKHIATGEGGAITTNDEELYKKLLSLRTHGITRDTNTFQNSADFASGVSGQEKYPSWYMEMQDLGFNYRITDFQAALGISQLKRAEEGIEKRITIATKYYNAFLGKSFIRGQSGVIPGHAYHLYIIEVDDRL